MPETMSQALATLLSAGYRVSFAPDSEDRADYLADLTGPLGSQAIGIGDTPAAALTSVWPPALFDDGQDDGVMDGPAVAAVARKVTVLREYIADALAGAVNGRPVLERVDSELAGVGALLAADPNAVEEGPGDDLEAYCRTCGHWIGHFLGLDGWQHFAGEPAPGGRRTLYDAGHEADPAWCVPPGRALAPADVAVIRSALPDAPAYATLLDRLGAANRFGGAQ